MDFRCGWLPVYSRHGCNRMGIRIALRRQLVTIRIERLADPPEPFQDRGEQSPLILRLCESVILNGFVFRRDDSAFFRILDTAARDEHRKPRLEFLPAQAFDFLCQGGEAVRQCCSIHAAS